MNNNFKLISSEDFEEIKTKLDSILGHLSQNNFEPPQSLGKWLSEKQAQEVTGKKATTLWKMRKKGLLAFTKINNKTFYDKESILQLLNNNRQDPF